MKHHFDNDESPRVYAKEQNLRTGESIETHSHAFDHLSIGCGGPVIVEVDGQEKTYVGAFCIRIEAHKKHRITAKGDSKWFCIWPTNERDVSKIDKSAIGD